jgi:DNA-binding GntR family transcriptional regulator
MSSVVELSLKLPARQTLADTVAESLRDAIFTGIFKPGQRLAEAWLASRLKVSRAPIREALASLEQEGLVCRASNGGTTVTELSSQDIEEICTLRRPLEVLAVRLATVRGGPGDWELLAQNIGETENISDPQQLAQMDLAFHELIVRTAGHSRLLTSWQNLRSQIRLIMVQRNLNDADSRRGTVRGHKQLLQAMQAGKVEEAAAIVERHLKTQSEWILHCLGEVEKIGPKLP